MTILFGNLTTAFTDFGKNPFAPNAKSNLYDAVNKDAAILVGIGAGSCESLAGSGWYTVR